MADPDLCEEYTSGTGGRENAGDFVGAAAV